MKFLTQPPHTALFPPSLPSPQPPWDPLLGGFLELPACLTSLTLPSLPSNAHQFSYHHYCVV
ncbi:hypothetical protein E2C01_080108 [Portunus trituberculatus]|uniref:Uncharacterized protein n=1 Tax=Portunus trituberculatus TaxID=210409 RepID=A0A5B7IXI6_PORTR|nr:hypothetical protein [Portunus trituberculatus]